MHERMNPIIELVRTATRIQIETPSILLEKSEKKEAIKYLENDDEIDINITPIDENLSLIEIKLKEDGKTHLCADCKHMEFKGEKLDSKLFCKLKNEFKEYWVDSCEDYVKGEYQ